jgi:hypothetical protein
MLYMLTFTINIPPMLAYIPYMDPMGHGRTHSYVCVQVVSKLVLDTVICHCSVDICRGMIAESFDIHSSGNYLCSFDPLDSYTFLIHIANYF